MTSEAEANLSAEQVRALLRYEPDTGRLFWLERPREMFPCIWSWKVWNKRYAGKEAFSSFNADGYNRGRIFNRNYFTHRVIWLFQTGSWPPDQIDHINGVRDDNRWSNLRSVSQTENGRNQRRNSRNTSGITGVSWIRKHRKWQAHIKVNGRDKFLGLFPTIEDAAAARAAANVEHGFSLRHGSDGIDYRAANTHASRAPNTQASASGKAETPQQRR